MNLLTIVYESINTTIIYSKFCHPKYSLPYRKPSVT